MNWDLIIFCFKIAIMAIVGIICVRLVIKKLELLSI